MRVIRNIMAHIQDLAAAGSDDPELAAWRDSTGSADGFPDWYDDGCAQRIALIGVVITAAALVMMAMV